MNKKRGYRYLTRWLSVGIVLAAAQLACSLTSGASSGATQPPQKATSTEAAAGRTSTPAEATQASGSQPTATAQKAAGGGGGGGGGFACFGSSEKGVSCLTDAGWTTFTTDNTDLQSDIINDMVACPDGKIYAGTKSEMGIFDGTQWNSVPIEGAYWADYVACGPDGSVWAAYYKGVSQYKDGTWKAYPSTAFDTGENAGLIYGLEVAPDGTVWVANSNSISSYDGKAWKEYKQGSGFDEKLFFNTLAVDSKGRVWTYYSGSLYRFENGAWKKIEMEFHVVVSLATDPQDRLWLNTDTEGVLILDGSKWSGLSYASGEIHSNGVFSEAFDQSGRTWLGMAYGIDILAGGSWTHYRMDNSGLADNEIKTVAVAGKGPALPETVTKKPGSIAGTVTKDGKPLANAQMEFCVEKISFSFTGETPCSNQPFQKATKTGADGKFSIADLPTGYYVLTLKMEDGKWAQLGTFGTSDRILVKEGEETDIGTLKVTES